LSEFNEALDFHTTNVNRVFTRIFNQNFLTQSRKAAKSQSEISNNSDILTDLVEMNERESEASNFKLHIQEPVSAIQPILSSLEKSDLKFDLDAKTVVILERLAKVSPPFAELLAANPSLIQGLPSIEKDFYDKNYLEILLAKVGAEKDFAHRLSILRQTWSGFLLEIVAYELFEKISRYKAKQLQTRLAEESLDAAIFITKAELEKRFAVEIRDFGFAVLGLGKLGGRGMDYGSDLDLVLVYDDRRAEEEKGRKGEEEKRRRGDR
jgi:glutamine synthetase adenylyltransferase